MRASLPLYNFDGTRAGRSALWRAIASELARDGLNDLPTALDFSAPPVPERIDEDVLFSQVCGYPLQTIYRGQAMLLGAPVYDFEHCAGATHVGVFVVRQDRPYRVLADLRGSRFLYNSRHSNSGMNLPRLALAELAQGQPFFAHVEESGTQADNLKRVASGEADATCVDNVTLGYYRYCLPNEAAVLRVIALTPPSPSIPFVTSSATEPATLQALRRALQRVAKNEEWAPQRAALFLRDIVPAQDAAYSGLLNYERVAIERGYPELR
jgi:ABC-type phosphate/phosphonate transport system substrate-binding protein